MTYELDESNGEKERECVRNWEGGGWVYWCRR